MNSIRRRQLAAVADKLEGLKSTLEAIYEAEDQSIDNVPENLWGTEQYEKMEEARDDLELAIDDFESVLSYIYGVVDL